MKKKTGPYLGRITPQGFKPKKTEQSPEDDSPISVRHFGAVHYFEQRSGPILQELEKRFPQWGQTLFVGAVMRLLYQSPLKEMRFYYQNSYASQIWSASIRSRQRANGGRLKYRSAPGWSPRSWGCLFLKKFGVTG
ncbi:MAG TPA: hypothetical protein PKC76_10120 [Saprospiraceae bacterium]|nr:hypothetical protein [Saprospiraceae bacterium]HMP24478.1 hypothetical protein [Saprospiraceae bacterium]